MTFEKLKTEAKAQGYRLVPIQPYIKLIPCACGRKRFEHWYAGNEGQYYRCPVCGEKGKIGKNDREARKLWNAKWE